MLVCAVTAGAGAASSFAEDNSAPPDSEYVRAYKQFIESPPNIKSLKVRVESLLFRVMFSADDIVNFESLAAKLKQPADSDRLTKYISAHLPPVTQSTLSNYNSGPNPRLQLALLSELNWHPLSRAGNPFPDQFSKHALRVF